MSQDYLYILKAIRPEMLEEGLSPQEEEITAEHWQYLVRLSEAGKLHLFGRTQTTSPDTFGLVIFQADSDSEARQIMEDDPGVKRGLMTGQLFPYQVAFIRKNKHLDGG